MTDAQLMKRTRSKLGKGRPLSQVKMAERCGYASRERISEIENGVRNLSGPARKLLEELLGKAD